jgi:hypothetical protein
MGIAALHPSYRSALAMTLEIVRSPDERSDIRGPLSRRPGYRCAHPGYKLTWSALCHTGSAIEYFTWLSAKLDSIEAMPSSRVSLFFRNAS